MHDCGLENEWLAERRDQIPMHFSIGGHFIVSYRAYLSRMFVTITVEGVLGVIEHNSESEKSRARIWCVLALDERETDQPLLGITND